MAQAGVLVVFNSRCGATETIAHAAAVGTVNARALPRLRRLPDDGDGPETCAETLRRMQKEYVAPTEADVAGAGGLILVPSGGSTPAAAAWQPFIDLLHRMANAGTLVDKIGAVVAGDDDTVTRFSAVLNACGVVRMAADGADARGLGRRVGTAVVGRGI